MYLLGKINYKLNFFGDSSLLGGRKGFKRGLAETVEGFMNPALAGYKSVRYNI